MIAFEMLAGHRPYAALAGEDWQSAVLGGSFTPISSHRPGAPAAWQSFFERAFDRASARRPGSVREFRSELERALLG